MPRNMHWRRSFASLHVAAGTLDIRRQIGRKVFFRRLLLVLFVSVLGIALMTGIYFIRLEPEGPFRCCWCSSILYDSMQQRHSRVFLFPAVPRLSPRVSAGGGTLILMYGVSDFFMPREVKYALSLRRR